MKLRHHFANDCHDLLLYSTIYRITSCLAENVQMEIITSVGLVWDYYFKIMMLVVQGERVLRGWGEKRGRFGWTDDVSLLS